MNAAFAPRMAAANAGHAGRATCRSRRTATALPDAAGGRRAAGAAAVRRLRQDRQTGRSSVAARRGGRVRRLAGARERLDGDRARGAGRQRVPVAARHVCLLFRRFRAFGDDVTRPYVRALEARRIRTCWSAAARSTSARRWRRCATRCVAIERPEDELARVRDAARPVLRARRRDAARLSRDAVSVRCTRSAQLPEPTRRPSWREVADALAVLRDLHAAQPPPDRRHDRAGCLAAVRAHAGLAIWPTGEQALANVCAAARPRAARRAAGRDVVPRVRRAARGRRRARRGRRGARSSRRAPRACAS